MSFIRVVEHKRPELILAGMACALTVSACGSGNGTATVLTDKPLVVNNQEVVPVTATVDAHLQNPWGIAVAPGLPLWIVDNNSNELTLYSGTGTVETQQATGSVTTPVAIPASAAGVPANATGEVYNGNGGFTIATPSGEETALFLYDGEGGTVGGWAKDSGATAVTAYDDGVAHGADHAVYKGLAIGSFGGVSYLYATDLHNNKVDVFDTHFEKPAAMQGKFVDPGLPAGFAPFGISVVNGQLFVTFAKQDPAKHDEITGAGLGYVDVFDFGGTFVSRFASGGSLNAPWGIALAPSGFAAVSGDVLIGNFGDGTLNAFKPQGAALAISEGALMAGNGQRLAFAGLWGLAFGNGDPDKPASTLFYTAGFASQTDGVLGSIVAGSTPATNPY